LCLEKASFEIGGGAGVIPSGGLAFLNSMVSEVYMD
jgi:hypothetical protein